MFELAILSPKMNDRLTVTSGFYLMMSYDDTTYNIGIRILAVLHGFATDIEKIRFSQQQNKFRKSRKIMKFECHT